MSSSTQSIPEETVVPRHVAIIMDGNGRWAKRRFLPRIAGHRAGVNTVREIVGACARQGVEALTLFAFSSENWRRPKDEVSLLMQLFVTALRQEITRLHEANVRFCVIGDIERFDAILRELIIEGQSLTRGNSGLRLNIAANYGGRWDILNAVNQLRSSPDAPQGKWTENDLVRHLALGDLPEPDLFIRTGGERRISNFLLWQLAYTELYFTDLLWPEFDEAALRAAFASFAQRERRFGRTGDQLSVDRKEERSAGA